MTSEYHRNIMDMPGGKIKDFVSSVREEYGRRRKKADKFLYRSVEKRYQNELVNVTQFVLADEIPPEGVDFLFVHSRAKGDEDGLLEFAKQLLDSGKVRRILIPGNDGQAFDPAITASEAHDKGKGKYKAWPGKAEWARMLDSIGIDLVRDPIYFSGPGVRTTREENDTVLEYAQDNNLRSVALLAHPHQLPRAMLGMVAGINNNQSGLVVYTCHPDSTEWYKEVYGSQGLESKPRYNHARDEMIRIPRYQKKGDLASFEELILYYKRRDRGLERLNGLFEFKQRSRSFRGDVIVLESAIGSLQRKDIY